MAAAGVDPKKTILFNQSQVHEHAELAWVFNCVARLGWLNRMTQFKEKAGKDRENASVGLYAYPVLMAADYPGLSRHACSGGRRSEAASGAARDIAQKFNNDFVGETRSAGFETAPLSGCRGHRGPATRVMSSARRHQEDVEVRARHVAHQH
jgi:tryptophanyl-tRNA synthetase